MPLNRPQDLPLNWSRRSPEAFTLIELVVVMTIIIILVTIAIPAVKALTKNNSQKQAVNMITTMVAEARALAIQQHAMAGVYIYEDTSTLNVSNVTNQTYAQLVFTFMAEYTTNYSGGTQGTSSFLPVPDSIAQPLPKGIAVATLDDGANLLKTGTSGGALGAATTRGRLIVFDENGQMVLRNNLTVYVSGTASVTQNTGSPGFIVFNLSDLQAAEAAGATTDTQIGQWIEQNSEMVIFNAYTGNVIR